MLTGSQLGCRLIAPAAWPCAWLHEYEAFHGLSEMVICLCIGGLILEVLHPGYPNEGRLLDFKET